MSRPRRLDWREVRVGSTNPPKLRAVREALKLFAPEADVAGLAAESGVPEQPVGFEEVVAGARNRALAAGAGAEVGVGYEDGLVRIPGAGADWFNIGCAVIRAGGEEGLGFSSGFAYPPGCAGPAAALRAPIGARFDALWSAWRSEAASDETPSALGAGNVGRLTLGALPRAEYTRHAVLCALLRFLHPDLYAEPQGAPLGAATERA